MSKKNPGASVRERLLILSKQRGEPFEAVMIRYTLERLLYRLGQTPHSEDFLLKGGMLLSVLSGSPYRQTRDLDLLGRGEPAAERLAAVFKDACNVDYPQDGLTFTDTIITRPIKEEQDYPGIRVLLSAFLAGARVPLQIDIGFGDAVLKPYYQAEFEPLLGFPLPEIKAYPLESVLAEKIHAMIARGLATSRMKDIYDLIYLAMSRSWPSQRVSDAVQLTFSRRQTPLPAELPIMFTPDFYDDASKLAQWAAFRKNVRHEELGALSDILLRLQKFWWPLFQTLGSGQVFKATWNPELWLWEI